MARQPDDLVLRVLKKIQQTQAKHSKRLDRIETHLDDVVTALGLATHANVRHEAVDKRLDELKARIDRLGKRR